MTQFATIYLELDDFTVQFLRGAFPQPRNLSFFQFPLSHDLEAAIQILAKGVHDPIDLESTKGLPIRFAVPSWKSEYKNFTLNKNSIQVLKRRIKTIYGLIAHDFLSQKRNEGYQIKDCIFLFLAKYEIEDTDTNYERVKKDFDRWRNRHAVKKYQKNNRKKTAVCPLP